jgi:hypothetical protein
MFPTFTCKCRKPSCNGVGTYESPDLDRPFEVREALIARLGESHAAPFEPPVAPRVSPEAGGAQDQARSRVDDAHLDVPIAPSHEPAARVAGAGIPCTLVLDRHGAAQKLIGPAASTVRPVATPLWRGLGVQVRQAGGWMPECAF